MIENLANDGYRSETVQKDTLQNLFDKGCYSELIQQRT